MTQQNEIKHSIKWQREYVSPHLPEDISHLLSLLLCSLVSTKLSLGHLQCTLVLPNLQKLSDTLLIGGKSSNLPNQASDESHPLSSFLK